ncbi:MAG: hypothetical protein ACO24D_16715 [bacterium]
MSFVKVGIQKPTYELGQDWTEKDLQSLHSQRVWAMYLALCSRRADESFMEFLEQTQDNTLLTDAIRLVADFHAWENTN